VVAVVAVLSLVVLLALVAVGQESAQVLRAITVRPTLVVAVGAVRALVETAVLV
jgi:hypothetical protein